MFLWNVASGRLAKFVRKNGIFVWLRVRTKEIHLDNSGWRSPLSGVGILKESPRIRLIAILCEGERNKALDMCTGNTGIYRSLWVDQSAQRRSPEKHPFRGRNYVVATSHLVTFSGVQGRFGFVRTAKSANDGISRVLGLFAWKYMLKKKQLAFTGNQSLSRRAWQHWMFHVSLLVSRNVWFLRRQSAREWCRPQPQIVLENIFMFRDLRWPFNDTQFRFYYSQGQLRTGLGLDDMHPASISTLPARKPTEAKFDAEAETRSNGSRPLHVGIEFSSATSGILRSGQKPLNDWNPAKACPKFPRRFQEIQVTGKTNVAVPTARLWSGESNELMFIWNELEAIADLIRTRKLSVQNDEKTEHIIWE